jgi:hypothetical protein
MGSRKGAKEKRGWEIHHEDTEGTEKRDRENRG